MNADVKDAGSDTSQVYCSVAENVCSRLLKVWTLLKKKPQNKRVTQIGAVGSAALHTVMEETTTDRVTAGDIRIGSVVNAVRRTRRSVQTEPGENIRRLKHVSLL